MDPLTLATCAGSLLLIVAAALPSVADRRMSMTLVWFAAAMSVVVLSVPRLAQTLRYVPDTEPSQVIRYGVNSLSGAIRHPPKNLLVIDGGSFPARGVEPNLLRKELGQLGYQATVVHLALGGGNHFERYQMYADLLRRPELSALNQQPNLVFMMENQSSYDTSPLMQLEENSYTDRAFHYLTPQNGWLALRALWTGGGSPNSMKTPIWTVLRHVLVNTFNVGVASRLVPWSRIKARSGYIPGGAKPRFRFKGLSKVIEAATDALPNDFHLTWLLDTREPRLKRLWGDRIDQWVSFAIPSTRARQMVDIRLYCGVTDSPCILPTDLHLLKELDNARLWRDDGHLSSKGAVLYTKWLARQLAQTGVLKK